MNVFETVKGSVTARKAAELYGVKVNRNGMALCPFHNDRTPSLKLDRRYHCFGCQADGDVIDLTAKLFGLTSKEAAVKLAEDFGVSYREKNMRTSISRKTGKKRSGDDRPSDKRRRFYHIYSDYLLLLRQWRIRYAPAREDEEWDPRFSEALMKFTQVEYILDVLMTGTEIEIAELTADLATVSSAIERRFINEKEGEKNDD